MFITGRELNGRKLVEKEWVNLPEHRWVSLGERYRRRAGSHGSGGATPERGHEHLSRGR